jgi:hypothetical protein
MTKNNQSLFAGQEEIVLVGGANQLNKTAQLTSASTEIAHDIITLVIADQEQYGPRVAASQQSHDEMDKLIADLGILDEVDIQFLKDEDDLVLDKMLKSQQSKRSRSKSKVMTQENYTSMMTAAIAEYLLRQAMGKPKGANYGGATSGDATYSEEELAKLATDPDALSRAIRNVQSKKSIAKSKIDFSVDSERWQQLLEAEGQLKDLRSSLSGTVNRTTQAAVTMLEDINLDELSAEDAMAQLAKLKETLAGR